MNILHLGKMGYNEAWAKQLEILEQVQAGAEDTLILVEHPPVLTLGANFHKENLMFTPEQYAAKGIEVITTDRGGDVTYHGPGQLVMYPIFDLNRHGKDLHKWMRGLEETQILLLKELGIDARRFPPNTGVWVGERKVAAIGVKIKRWVSLHGIAINCNNDLGPFSLIIPCGIQGYGVTSISQLLNRDVSPADIEELTIQSFKQVFESSHD